MSERHAHGQSRFALIFFILAATIGSAAAGLAIVLITTIGPMSGHSSPYANVFGVTTLLLLTGSVFLERARRFVRRERQRAFRRSLVVASGIGVLFVAVQSFALWLLLAHQNPSEAQTGADAFVFVFATMHGLHFSIALLFLLFVTLHAFGDRYDHEYHWGVVVAAYFWHFLGAAWLFILGVLLISLASHAVVAVAPISATRWLQWEASDKQETFAAGPCVAACCTAPAETFQQPISRSIIDEMAMCTAFRCGDLLSRFDG